VWRRQNVPGESDERLKWGWKKGASMPMGPLCGARQTLHGDLKLKRAVPRVSSYLPVELRCWYEIPLHDPGAAGNETNNPDRSGKRHS